MAEETLDSDFFQTLFRVLRDLLSPATDIFGDADARRELLGTLGLNGSANVGSLPDTTQLDAYIAAAAGEADEFALIGAIADFVAVTAAIEGAIRAGIDGDDAGAGFAVDEIMGAFFNTLLMEYVRRQNPPVHAFAQLITTINTNTAAIGGSESVASSLRDFFTRLTGGLDTAEEAEAVSQTIFSLLALALWLIDKYVVDDREAVALKMGYGYEGITDSETPISDEAANRTLSYSITAAPFDNPNNKGTLYNSFTFVPEEHGGIAFVTDLSGVVDLTLPVSDDISFKIDVDGDGLFRIGEAASADLGPNNKLALTFKHKLPDGGKFRLFPTPEIKTGLKSYSVKIAVSPKDFNVHFSGKIPFELKRDEDAGFPQNLLPKSIKKEIPLDFGYSLNNDFYFGSGGGNPAPPPTEPVAADAEPPPAEPDGVAAIIATLIELIDLRIPINEDIGGVVGLQVLNIKAGVEGDFQELKLESSIDFWVKFASVMQVTISRLGAEIVFTERDDSAGFLGYDVSVNFKPPTGAGIVVDATAVKGGGYLYFDADNGEYFGAMELEIKEVLTLKAIGLINTKMPDGSNGFSMLVLITAEFSPITLPFGFTLDGVGGLLGVDRTVEVESLRVGVRTNAIKSILFPEDVVGNITRIISDIRDFFPIKEDQFVIGLMAQIGYAGSDLVKIELGVIVEVPDPKILILGVIKVVAPSEDADALRLQVNFLGLIDFANEFAYFEAHLYDSHVVKLPLTGSLAFVIGWGDNGMFALSVGGFHPDFNDYPTVPTLPGAFREMDRVGMSLLDSKNPKLTIECYFAVTSNSLQFGAKLELLASGPMGFNVYGLLAFDALFIFDPFSFIISLEATLAIRRKTKILFGISFRGSLAGPNPWNIEGEVSFGILFFDITIPVRATWGNELDEDAAEVVSLTGMLRKELADQRNWQGRPGQRAHHTVTHRALEQVGEDELVIFPFGELGFNQRVLPLNTEIEKYGSMVPEGETRVGIREVRIADEVVPTTASRELFAPGNFIDLTENEKLSRKSFERFDSGMELRNSDKLQTSPRTVDPVDLDYELNYTEDDKPDTYLSKLQSHAFNHLVRNASVSRAEVSWQQRPERGLNALQAVSLASEEEGYAIARTDNMQAVEGAARFDTLSQANQAMAQAVANDPDLDGQLQVVERYELAG